MFGLADDLSLGVQTGRDPQVQFKPKCSLASVTSPWASRPNLIALLNSARIEPNVDLATIWKHR